ncbi:SUN domain-containing protein [Photobacterium sagamiensis]|uniref:porin n=1 Tax=Photobacterium sagamiensis TaxID=2910241 RepID=UPI003D107A03
MKKMLLCAASMLVAHQVSAAPALQGYYQAKELITYTANKIQQNKAEYFMLDYALTQPAQYQAQFVAYNDALGYFQAKNSGVNGDLFKRIVQKVNPEGLRDQYVCRVDVAGVKLAYVAKRDEGCSSNYDNKPMAISQKGTKVTFFRRWDFDPTQSHFDIQSYDNNVAAKTEILTLDYVLKFEGRWIGSSVRVIKGQTILDSGATKPTYDVANYQYSGPRSGIITGGESLLYSEAPYFITDDTEDTAADDSANHVAKTVFNTFGVMDGKYRGRNVNTDRPVYWVNRDYVSQYTLENTNKAYFDSDPQNFVIETSLTGPSDSWVWVDETVWDPEKGTDQASGGDWVSHAFNNTHNLTGESPTFCMIEDIAKGRPVTGYFTEDGKGMWVPSMNNCKEVDSGYVPKIYTHFTNGNGEKVAVSSLRQSAQDIIHVRTQHPQGEKDLLTLDDVKAMKSSPRYQQIKADLSQRFDWAKPYDILK